MDIFSFTYECQYVNEDISWVTIIELASHVKVGQFWLESVRK
jgi:hypothetical protein